MPKKKNSTSFFKVFLNTFLLLFTAFIGVVILVLAEISVRYSGISWNHTAVYYLIPIGTIPMFYLTLIRTFKHENLN